MTHFKFLETVIINQNCMYREIRMKFNSGNACYHSVQNTFLSLWLSRSINTVMQTIIVFLLLAVGVKLSLSHEGKNIG
jgi:hypothetical protein